MRLTPGHALPLCSVCNYSVVRLPDGTRGYRAPWQTATDARIVGAAGTARLLPKATRVTVLAGPYELATLGLAHVTRPTSEAG